MNKLAIFFIVLTAANAQNPRHVLAGHPRMFMNSTIADTWQGPTSRLDARSALMFGGNATAVADFNTLKALCTSSAPTFYNVGDEGYMNTPFAYSMLYQVYHHAGNDATANPYAAALWNSFSGHYPQPVTVTSIVVSGGTATVTTTVANAFSNTWTGVWGVTNDNLAGSKFITVTSPTTFTYSTTEPNQTHTESGMYASQIFTGVDSSAQTGIVLMSLAEYWDNCHDWLVANAHDGYILDMIKTLYWVNTLTRSSGGFSTNIKDSDFHNYSSKCEMGILMAGLALYGDDPLGATMLDEGAGYLWEGISVKPTSNSSDSFTYNVKASVDALTGGAMNWEGPTYWRSGAIRFIFGIEAYDTATARFSNLWVNQFPTAYKGAYYKIYCRVPNGTVVAFGDASAGGVYAGRDNFGIVILNDRFPDPHFVWMVDNDTPSNWDSGSGGFTGLVWKLMFYPYVNGPGSHDLTDLPPSAQFGTDIMLKTDWTANSSFFAYSGSLRGAYHRHDNAGSWSLYNRDYLVLENPYTDSDSDTYYNYNRRTIGGNDLTIYDPSDCWMNNTPTCGSWSFFTGNLVNDGGQLLSWRRFNPPLSNDEFDQNRAWSGTVYSDSNAPVYNEIDNQTMPIFFAGTGFEHIRHDLTHFYRNAYTGTGHNPNIKVASTNGVIREIIHFQPTLGTLAPIVMFDRVTSTNSTFKKSWLLHTINAPIVNGVTSTPGDSTTVSATVTRVDNTTGRLYVTHLLPSAPNVRTVGGNACTPKVIVGATNANPAVYNIPAHGLTVGEKLRLDTGTVAVNGTNSQWWPLWLFDVSFGGSCVYNTVASVVDADHITISGCGGDSTGFPTFASSFTSGAGAPVAAGSSTGAVYYQTNAVPSGNNVWQWNGSAWINLQTTGSLSGFSPSYGFNGPILRTHASCNWADYVDQFGPTGSGPAHLWEPAMDDTADSTKMAWMVAESPSSNNLTDYFLNVLTPVTTSDPAPTITQVTGSGVSGSIVADASGFYIGVFPNVAISQTSLTYTATHAGTGFNVVSGLIANQPYSVIQSGTALTTATSDSSGSLSFSETGGGTFSINSAGGTKLSITSNGVGHTSNSIGH